MTARQHDAPDCAGRNGVRNWTVHQYGYERYVVLNERGHEVAATHRRDTARLIAAAPELLEACQKLDAWWLEEFPEGPEGSREWAGGLGQLSEDTIEVWRTIRAAIARATGAA